MQKIAFGDSQPWDSTHRQNDYQVEALNHFNQILSWKDAGYDELGEISDIRGVIMAGDITQNGRDGRVFSDDEYGEFIQRYGLCGIKELKYKMVDFHSSRPGHDLRYALDGTLMKELGWEPKVSIDERISQVVNWTLNNDRWLKL